ncbi:URK1, partial [Fusarium albosuccineum]
PVASRRLARRAPQSPAANATATESRAASPGLFLSSPTRPSPSKSTHHNSDSDDDLPAIRTDRFNALKQRYQQKRLAREAAEEAEKAERQARQEQLAQDVEQTPSDENDSGITDDEGGRRLTQNDRPKVRKASKKAIEEMNRETQRMARNMQLTHEAKTRKKITKNSLFERFNYRPAGEPEPKIVSSSRGPTPHSDVEMQDAETPPSSPPTAKQSAGAVVEDDDEDLPTVESLAESSKLRLDKGKGKAVDIPDRQEMPVQKPKRQVRVKLPPVRANVTMLDLDDELEITTTTKDRINAVFDSVPSKKAQEPNSIQALRALAQVKSPGKETRRRDDNHGMTVGELQAYLQQKARQQAKLERDRRLEMLKAQGVVIQTAEERERQMQEVEDLVAKAREEAQKIMQEERAAAKKEKKENGEADPLAWDDSDDEEYQASGNEADTEASAVELSGSEEEEDGSDEEVEGNPMLEAEAEDAESEASAEDAEDSTPMVSQDVHDDADDLPVLSKRRARKPVTIISDDEDEDTVEPTPKPKATTMHTSPTVPSTQSPAAPTSVLRSAKKTFIPGLPVQGPAGLGLTQIFAGTMDDSQMDSASGPTQSMMPDFDHFPDSNFSATMDEPMEDMILDSQKDDTQKTTQGVRLNFSQSQMRGLDSLLREESTQLSDMIELSQDGGLQEHTPLKDRFMDAPHSTVDTVMVDPAEAGQESPLVRRGRLRRRMETPLRIEETPEPTAAEKVDTAFNLLKEGAKKEKKRQLQEEYNHKKSKAKEMVEEQAEESEDEYAGLGGVDGEDSDNESVASLKEIIDDAAGNDVDEAKLAAFYADRERAEDEKQVEKLFKDITTGMLRRKRGAGYDLDDSDDDGEARRRMKRRQFAKMQKALFSDERVKKIAENPGNEAFLRTIEDRGSDDEMDILGAPEEPNESSQQSQSQEDESNKPQTIPDSQPRKALGSAVNRPPANMRRTQDGKKPSNIGEVRETLSNLLEEPHGSVIPATEIGSDSEGEEEATPSSARSDKENYAPNPRRGRVAVVDRISLKRNSSSSVSTGRLAFATASTSSFKVPALLRRATTNSLVSGSASTTSSGASTPASGFGEDAKIKKGASKKSGVHAFARDTERRAKLEQSERRREERKVKGAERRVGVVGGLLGKGTFE